MFPIAPAYAEEAASPHIEVGVGQSYIYQGARPIARVLVSDLEIARVQLLEQGQVQVLGQDLGTTDLWVWFRDAMDAPVRTTISVHRDLADLEYRIREVVVDPAAVRAYSLNDRLVLDGTVPDVETLESLAQLGSVYDEHFVNLLQVAGDHQVQLRVVFAEINRSSLREMGLDVLWNDGGILAGTSLTLGTSPPAAVADAFSLFGTLGSPFELSATLSVLEQNRLGKTLARPTLVAMSGQKASFLAGGEIPIPVSQYGTRVSAEFREYGVKVDFVPTVLGNEVVDLQAYVEVSDIDPANSVTLTDVAIPALTTRRSETHVRLNNGATFAMAGMLGDSVQSNVAKIPILGDIPILGALFRYVRHERKEVEIVIFVTPELVRPLGAGEVPAPPGTLENNDPTDFEFFLLGMDHHGARPAPAAGLER